MARHTHDDGLQAHDLVCDGWSDLLPSPTDTYQDWQLLCDEAANPVCNAPIGGPTHCPTCQPAPHPALPRHRKPARYDWSGFGARFAVTGGDTSGRAVPGVAGEPRLADSNSLGEAVWRVSW
ncbi:hypothetical protein AB0M43_37335 [Longispora sp. NPDC051575]|uniref:hypothetical protein n=1 Tax=Longispora sp. NPDC051575 TaxID=3154943 RepID=UPI00341CD8A7